MHLSCSLFISHRSGGGNKDTSLDASSEVPERTCNDATKEAKLHGLAVSFYCVVTKRSFSGFHLTRPKRGGGYGCSPPPSFAQTLRRVNHAGNLSLHPFMGKTVRIIRNPTAHCKQGGNKYDIGYGDYQTVRTGYCGIILSRVMITISSVCA